MEGKLGIGLRIPEILETKPPEGGGGGGGFLSTGDLGAFWKKSWGFKDFWGSGRRRRKF